MKITEKRAAMSNDLTIFSLVLVFSSFSEKKIDLTLLWHILTRY